MTEKKKGKAGYEKELSMGLAVAGGVLSGTAAPAQAAAGDVTISETNFPDANFRKVLKGTDYDANEDGVLSKKEIENIIYIDVWDKSINSLQGVEFFVNLEYLDCVYTNISDIDVSKNVKLKSLYCYNNRLVCLDLNVDNIDQFSCENNVRYVSVNSSGEFDLSTLKGFQVKQASK